MVMELSKGGQKDFQWVPSAYWIFLSSFYFQQKHTPASGHSKLHTQIQDYTANIHSPRADCVVSVGVLMAYQHEQPSGFW